jgi:hypothetical protein
MAFSQIYETTIVDVESNLSAHFVVVPNRSLQEADSEENPDLFKALGLHFKSKLPSGNFNH